MKRLAVSIFLALFGLTAVWAEDLVVYYSMTGHTKTAAEALAEELKADLVRIEDVEAPDVHKLYERSYFDKFKKKPAPIKKVGVTISKYKRIFIGSPVWWGEQAPEISTFLKDNDLSGKDVVLFFTSGGGGAGKAIGKLTKEIEAKGGKVVSTFLISTPGLSSEAIAEKARKIATKYKKK